MRSLENVLLLANVAALVLRRSNRVPPPWDRSVPLAALLLMVAQVAVEGYRWQMYPGYLVTLWLFVSSILPHKARFCPWPTLAGIGCVLCAAALCISLPVFELPPPTGPFAVGSVTRHLVDPGRSEPRASILGARRELMIQIWYPAERGGPAHYYCSRAEMPFKKEQLSLVRTHAAEGVPIARNPGRYPVLVFSPSWQGRRYQNTFQCEELASHGYVVVATDHPHGTELMVFPDGRRVATKLGDWIDFSSFEALQASLRVDDAELQVRTADVRFVLDTLERNNQEDSTGLLTGRLDLSRVGIFGHSFGGGVAAEACRNDPRFRAGVDLDGCFFGESAKDGVDKPFLVMTSEGPGPTSAPPSRTMDPRSLARAFTDQDSRNVRRSLENHGGYLLHIRGTSHMSFCDSPLFSPIRRLTGAGPIDAGRGMSIINSYTLTFFNQYMNLRAEPLMSDLASLYPEARLESWPLSARERTSPALVRDPARYALGE